MREGRVRILSRDKSNDGSLSLWGTKIVGFVCVPTKREKQNDVWVSVLVLSAFFTWCLQCGVNCFVRNSAGVGPVLDSHVPLLSPVGGPTVSEDPVWSVRFKIKAGESDTVVQCPIAAISAIVISHDASGIKLPIVGVHADSDNSIGFNRFRHFLLVHVITPTRETGVSGVAPIGVGSINNANSLGARSS